MKRIFLLILLAISCFFLAGAADYYVDATTGNNANDGSSGSPWKTITYALNQISGTGHTLNVAAGTYNTTLGETFPIYVKNGVSLIGSGIDVSIIDADNTNTVLRCVSIVDPSTTIEGFTIQGGGNVDSGSGIFISAGSALTIRNNKITGNTNNTSGDGGGIYVTNSSPLILSNVITANNPGTVGDGAGIYVYNGSPLIKGNNITGNLSYGDGLYISGSSSSPRVVNNVITDNPEGGIYIVSSNPSLINNTISENNGDGVYVATSSLDSVFNNIISLNSGYGIRESGTTSDPGKVWYNLFYANFSGLYYDEGTTAYYTASSLNTGVTECTNNIDGDPIFADRENDDYNLQLGSPAIDTGDPAFDYSNEPSPNGGRINIGAYGNTTEAATSDPGPPTLPDSLYVDAVSGSNTTGNGSSGTPWKTITYALSQVTGTGHTLFVAAGTYNTTLGETFPIYVKNGVSLIGSGIDVSIIDADNTNTVLRCVSIVDPSTTIEGFTIQGGGNVVSGSGIFISAGSMLNITNNKISGNVTEAWGMGAGIYVENSSPQIINNLITGNEPGAFGDGGGIYINNASPLVKGNRITNNTYYGYGLHITGSTSSPKIENNIIAKNVEGGIYIVSSGPSLINNTISENTGNGIYISSSLVDSIFNNILSYNTSWGIYESGTTSDPGKAWYNLFYANTSGLYYDEGTTDYYTANSLNTGVAECANNIDGDPMFVDKTNDDYNLSISSPAIDAGDPDPFFNDPDGSRNDIGALAFDTPPAVPQNLSAAAGAEKITLQWNPNTEPDLDKYNIYRDLFSPATTLVDSVISSSPPDTFYVDTGLIVGQDYYYRIKAKDIALNESDFSGEVMGTPITGLQQDSLVLVALYDSTDGANWTDNSNWLFGNVLTWYGITVSGNRVTQIDLNSNNLVGTIPTEIGNLTNLTNLILESNQLSASISSEIGNLSNLTNLKLDYNQLSGSIPTEIGNLTNLTNLHLQYNQLSSSIPIEIGNLTNLTQLYLCGNQLSGSIPTEIGNLTNLTNLQLQDNQLSGSIPTEIGNLINLTVLYLSGNQLSGSIPATIGNLINLTDLLAEWNQLSGLIPTEIWNLTNLLTLKLSGNQLSGTLPAEIANLINLEAFYIYANSLSGAIPAEILNLTNLSGLWIGSNEFTDLPDLSSLTLIAELKIDNNKFTFKDVEPNIGVPSTTFTYSPQDSVGQIIDTTVYVGTSYTMSVSTGGASSQYQWKKDGTNIGVISADSTYTFNPVAFSDTGAYTCEITNTVATDLTLYSRPLNVFVDYSPLQKDSLALVALYDSTDGANWTDNTNWLTGNVSTWYGITVTNGRVTTTNQDNNNLNGTIPLLIGDLDSLQILNLQENQLTGSLPAEIGNLTNLTYLTLSSNQLSGSIPLEIGILTNLTYLDFNSNQLTGSIPTEIENLVNLEDLRLADNQLSDSIPNGIWNIINLKFLYLHNNQLTDTITNSITNLTNLNVLWLGGNQLTGIIPSEIGNLTNLTQFAIYGCQITGIIPSEIGNLINLEMLLIEDNQISGTVPPEIINLTKLVYLWINGNQFTNLPDLSTLDSLDYLSIENNQFTFKDIEPNIGVASTTYTYSPQDSVGEIIDTTVYVGTSYTMSVSTGGASSQYQWKKNGTNIGILSADSTYTINPVAFSDTGAYTCEITNTVATDLTLYSRPVNVFVDYSPLQKDSLALIALYDSTDGANWINNTNWLTGQPLSNWYGITVSGGRVTEVNLRNNNLVGTIPPEIGNLTNLLRLRLSENQISGSIPSEICNLLNLNSLSFANNQLSGTIPITIDNLVNLGDLELNNNQLSGSIPTGIGDLINLTAITLCNNQFTDTIPMEIGYLVNLSQLLLDGNQFTGPIPSEIGDLINLGNLNLSSNQLSGSIPSEIGNLTNLQYLYLGGNQLSGSIPTEIGNLTNLTWLDLNNNQLTGSIPIEIGNLTNLYYLVLWFNQLTGSIPSEIGNLTNLTWLDLNNNQLTGEIPLEIGNLTNLRGLHLSGNQLTGSIPSEIGNLTNLYHLDLRYNQLTGAVPNSFTGLAELEKLWLNDNSLVDLPDLSSLDSLYWLWIEYNQFTFKDIEPNIGVPDSVFTYSPQDSVGQIIDTTVYVGTDFTLFVSTGGASSQYQWKKDGTNTGTVSGDSTYTINPVAFSDSGTYTCKITNTVATELTLNSRPINVSVVSNPADENDILTYSFPEQTGAATIDDVNYTVSIEVALGTDVTALVATFTISDLATIAVGATAQVSEVTANDFTNTVTYTVTSGNAAQQDWVVTVTVATSLSSENDILSFSFTEQTGAATIDDANHTVDIEVAYGTNVSALTATFTISDLATITIGATTQVSGVTVNDFSSPVTYTVTAEDGTPQDWVVTVSEAGILVISDFPYSEDFESGNGGWRTGGANSSWQYGTPAGSTINSAASGTNSWVTNLTGDYNPDEVSYIMSPRFDLSSIDYPKIEFSIWWDSEGFYDGANFQYKQGTGVWKTLGTDEGDDSWYNSSYLYSIEKGFGFDINNSAGWSGDDEWGYGSNGWVTVDHALTSIENRSDVRFRIAFASNSGYENDGVAIDDINIFSDPTGIDPVKTGLSDIQIYPNPNEGTFTLVYNGEWDVDLNLQLINLQGQVILLEQTETGNKFSKKFELDYLPPGLYYFRLIHKEDVIVKKMVVR